VQWKRRLQYETRKKKKNERHTHNSIKRKLASNIAVVLKADEGITIVITYLDDKHMKVRDFIFNNSFSIINNDLTSTFKK